MSLISKVAYTHPKAPEGLIPLFNVSTGTPSCPPELWRDPEPGGQSLSLEVQDQGGLQTAAMSQTLRAAGHGGAAFSEAPEEGGMGEHGQSKVLFTMGTISSLPLLSLSTPPQTQESRELRFPPTSISFTQVQNRQASPLRREESSPRSFATEWEQSQLSSPASAAMQRKQSRIPGLGRGVGCGGSGQDATRG